MTLDDARYLSPEQAVGEPAGPESDVYALALILFEAVTGSAAYEGSTPEAILRARLDTPLPVRLELGTLDMVLAQAAVPDPRLRLDAAQFSARLGAVVGDASPLIVHPGAEEPLLAQFEPLEAAQLDRLHRSFGRTGDRPRADRRGGGIPESARVVKSEHPRCARRSGARRDSSGLSTTFREPSGVAGLSRRRDHHHRPRRSSPACSGKRASSRRATPCPTSSGMTTKQASSAIASDGYTPEHRHAYSPRVARTTSSPSRRSPARRRSPVP